MKTFTEITGIASVVENQQLVFEAEDKPKGLFALLGWANAFFKGDSKASGEKNDVAAAKTSAREEKAGFKKALKDKQKELKKQAKLIKVQAERAKNKKIYDDILAGFDERINAAAKQAQAFEKLATGKGGNGPDVKTIQAMCDLAINQTGVKADDGDTGEGKGTKMMVAALLDAKTGQPLEPIKKKDASGNETDEIDTDATAKMYSRNAVRQWATCGLLSKKQLTNLGISDDMLDNPVDDTKWKDFDDDGKLDTINKVFDEVKKDNPALGEALNKGANIVGSGDKDALDSMLAEAVTGDAMDKELARRIELQKAQADMELARQEADVQKEALSEVTAAAKDVTDAKNIADAIDSETGKPKEGAKVLMSSNGKQMKVGDIVYDITGGIPTKAKKQDASTDDWIDATNMNEPEELTDDEKFGENDFNANLDQENDGGLELADGDKLKENNALVKKLRDAGYSDEDIMTKFNGKKKSEIDIDAINSELQSKRDKERKDAADLKSKLKDIQKEAADKATKAKETLDKKIKDYNSSQEKEEDKLPNGTTAEDVNKKVEQIDKDLEKKSAQTYDKLGIKPPTEATVQAEIDECNQKIDKAKEAAKEARAAFANPDAKAAYRKANDAEYNGVYDKADARDLMQFAEISEKDVAVENPEQYTYIDKDGKEQTAKKPDPNADPNSQEYKDYYDNLDQHFASEPLSDDDKKALKYTFSRSEDGTLTAYTDDGSEVKDEEEVKKLMSQQLKAQAIQGKALKAKANIQKNLDAAEKKIKDPNTSPEEKDKAKVDKEKYEKMQELAGIKPKHDEETDPADPQDETDDYQDGDVRDDNDDDLEDDEETEEVYNDGEKKEKKDPHKVWKQRTYKRGDKTFKTNSYYNKKGNSISKEEFQDKVRRYEKHKNESLVITKQNKVFEIRSTEYKRIVKETKEPSKFTFTKLSQLKK